MSKMDFLKDEINSLKEQELFNVIRTIEGPQGSRFQVGGRAVLNLCSNNYLGFADHPDLKKAAKAAIDRYGVGPGAVRSISGTQDIHIELEKKLADFKEAPGCIVLQGGFVANLSVIPAITAAGDVILSDELNHASIIDGCRLSKAKVVRYAHNDVGDLKLKLADVRKEARRILIITDGVFSMDGDIAPLPAIVDAADEYGAMVMVDDAHGEGVLGKSGRGIVNHFNLEGRVDIEVGTLSKAFGVMGGFITGPTVLIDYLKQRARPFLFSTGLTPADAAASIAAIDVLLESDELVKKLWANAEYFREALQALGFDTGKTETPITPVILGEESVASEFSAILLEKGILAQAIKFPTVARGKARIRCMLSAAHRKEDLDFAIETFGQVGKTLGVLG